MVNWLWSDCQLGKCFDNWKQRVCGFFGLACEVFNNGCEVAFKQLHDDFDFSRSFPHLYDRDNRKFGFPEHFS
ncbi:hypothetical protein FBY06_11468 [Pseudomonas sp. SJZ085]|nr:hypothetical protein FBX99_11468 [Pseudomonas sp. SJZ074]TWC36396.1 hypothetical protein FBY06_11468 [Pseudomonas sp. SJZ085]